VRAARAGLVFGALALAVACGVNEDYVAPVRVVPGAAARAALIGHETKADAGAPAPARVHVMKAGEELGGPNAIGAPGDLLLENDEVAFVIDRLGSSAGFAESGGNIVDAADATLRKDELGQVFTYFGTFPRQGVYDKLASGVDPDGAAWVEARGRELYAADLAVTTRYTLHAGDRAVLIETTLENHGASPVPAITLGDAIQWGGAEKFAPDRGRDFKGPSSGAYLAGIGRSVSYAITSTDAAIDAISGPSWSDTVQSKSSTIAPGQKVQYARIFLVGPRPDVASVVSELTQTAGGAVGEVQVALEGASGATTWTPEGEVVVSSAAGKPIMNLRPAEPALSVKAALPPGSYLLAYGGGGGRGPRGSAVKVDVAAGKSTTATVGVTAPGRIKLQCLAAVPGAPSAPPSATPCKATFVAKAGANPDFGPGHVAGPAKNQVTTDAGAIDVPLSPGAYHVLLTRGPEWSAASFDVTIEEGKTAEPCSADACVLRRVVETSGYVAADFHQHTMLGVDAPTATVDRVIANVAEGVEIAVASEHNVVADLAPIVRDRRLGAYLVAIAGDELTTDASKKPWGHANVFPLALDRTKPRAGAPPVNDREAKAIFADLRATLARPFVIQINHPRSGNTGYFDLLQFDRATGVGTGAGYDPAFDALEIWNGRNVGARDGVLADYLALLRTRHPVTATGNTDTHGVIAQEAGYPRTYVRVKDDQRLDAWSDARTDELVKSLREVRDVVVTNGPFVRIDAGGTGIGGVVKAKNHVVSATVHVECTPWMSVEELVVRRAVGAKGDGEETLKLPVSLTKKERDGGTVLVADVPLRLTFAKDDAFVVIVRGAKPLAPVLGGDPTETLPYATTGAIWVDDDGDGKSLGR
jgi:antitoxin (DNA-binding transcriptional repressor) of toxin-antitoxin stability system